MMRRFVLAFAALAMSAGLAAQAAPGSENAPRLRHGYVDDRYGQLHYAIAQPAKPSSKPPIILLHQATRSSVELAALTAAMGQDRVAIAIDIPGHGGSDGPAAQPTLEDYVAAIDEGLHGLGYGPDKPVDLFGHHTGADIAVELAIAEPRMVRRIVVSGLYDLPDEKVREALAALKAPATATEAFDQMCAELPRRSKLYESWGLTDAEWGPVRADAIRALTHIEYAHVAAYTYTPKFKARMGKVTQPVLVIARDDGITQPTIEATALFPHATLAEGVYPPGAFFTNVGPVAARIRAFLDR